MICDGSPPDAPNGGFRTWVNSSHEYNTVAKYGCGHHAEFVPDGDGDDADEVVESRCLWNKTWSLQDLPDCRITHCPIVPQPPSSSRLLHQPKVEHVEHETLELQSGELAASMIN